MIRSIIRILFCLFLIAGIAFFRFAEPENIVDGFSNVVEFLGKTQLTSEYKLIGERYDETDDYTGCYKCSADDETGQDVIYGGCSISDIDLKIKGRVETDSGNVNIRIRCGSDVYEIDIDENGLFEDKIEFDGGGSYVMIQYEHFSGNIDLKTEYA